MYELLKTTAHGLFFPAVLTFMNRVMWSTCGSCEKHQPCDPTQTPEGRSEGRLEGSFDPLSGSDLLSNL